MSKLFACSESFPVDNVDLLIYFLFLFSFGSGASYAFLLLAIETFGYLGREVSFSCPSLVMRQRQMGASTEVH